jgi:hypothetical protein
MSKVILYTNLYELNKYDAGGDAVGYIEKTSFYNTMCIMSTAHLRAPQPMQYITPSYFIMNKNLETTKSIPEAENK